MSRRLLITHALPYANGPLHLGHMLGYIQADIWARARRMMGDEVVFVAADDAHGTPIMLAAEKAGLSPEAFIAGIRAGHEADFAGFHFSFDNYYTTHSEENRELSTLIYTRLRDSGYIAKRDIQQLYDPEKAMFLPDRYIKGICPNCGTPDQYGDNCEHCGATYAPTDLIKPYSVMSGATPVLRDSEHYFFELSKFEPLLRDWFAGKFSEGRPVADSGVVAKLGEWLDGGLKDWDISRDAPYFGFPIPDAPGKFFYVWLDAPVGYLASFKNLCDRTEGLDFDDFLAPDSTAEMHHFIGKDIINFHGLFWPAMLHGAGMRPPTALHVNGYLTVNGAKMSKSRGTFIQARTYLDVGLHPECLRYYFATMLDDAPVDVDLDLKAFEERVNSHLVGKWVNIASRTAGFVHTFFDGRLAGHFGATETALWHSLVEQYEGIAELYAESSFAEVTRRFVQMADLVNGHIAATAPWTLAKDPSRRAELHQVCSFALTAFRLLAGLLKPILPATVAAAEAFLGAPIVDFDDARTELHHHTIHAFEPLLGRIDPKRIESMVESSKESLGTPAAEATPAKSPREPGKAMSDNTSAPAANDAIATIGIDDFARLDLRIGKVTACEFVEGSDKLLRFELDAGPLGTRQIFSGIRAAYAEPTKLVGRNVVFIANLAPRKMRFGLSQGMILSAGEGGSDLFLLDADQGARPGATVR